VAFGFIETHLTQTFASEVPEIEIGERKLKVGLDAAQVEAMKRLIPLGRAGTPEEAAGAVLLFCLPESDFISGEIVVAAGGLRMCIPTVRAAVKLGRRRRPEGLSITCITDSRPRAPAIAISELSLPSLHSSVLHKVGQRLRTRQPVASGPAGRLPLGDAHRIILA
jgi:Enoyl-(Acyl carrier protein) reductase